MSSHPDEPASTSARLRRVVAVAFRSLASGLFLASCSPSASPEYLRRFVLWSPSGTDDWRRFPSRTVGRAPEPFRYVEDPSIAQRYAPLLREVTYQHAGRPRTVPLDDTLVETGTTAFIVIRDGLVIREDYLNGHRRDSLTRAFSVSKSVTSALVGIALSEGKVRALDDPFVRYLPELRGRGYDGITIRHLLAMSAGFRFSYGRRPWADSPLLYWNPDIRSVILGGPPRLSPPGERFNYSDYSSAVLGMVLERATGATVSSYFEDRIWKRIGAEHDASWSIDHEGDGLEYTASGFNGRAIDLVKIGSLYLDGGAWIGQQVVPEPWVTDSVTPPPVELPGLSERDKSEQVFYGYGWWGHVLDGGETCFYAHGYRGQLLYACPRRRLLIARFGRELGSVGEAWPMLLRALAEKFPPT
jgi:CubicO group peptidase (beta-lactamase class C family)